MTTQRGQSVHADSVLPERIRSLLEAQPYAVLCTQGQSQPYGSVVAFAPNPDLKAVSFATPITTRKFRLMAECDRVAMVVDSRSVSQADMMQVEAVTATGKAVQLQLGPEFETWADRLIGRHPQLMTFVRSPSCGLFRMDIVRYFHVERFQEVRQWAP